MFDATLLDSSPERVPVLDWRHWSGALGVGVVGGFATYFILPLMFSPSPKARLLGSFLLGIGVMFYELMLWYVLADARHLRLNAWRWSIALLVLNVVGFVAYLVYSAYKTGDWKRATLPMAYISEGVIVCLMLFAPLINTQALPDARWRLTSIPPPRKGTPTGNPHVKPTIHTPARTDTTVRLIFPQPFRLHSSGPEPGNVSGALGDPAFAGFPAIGDTGGVPFGPTIGEAMPPLPKPAVKPASPKPVFISSRVEEAKLIFNPKPVYPQMAIVTRTEGAVELEAIISKEGTIQQLKVVSGSPLLIKSAVDAVSRWRYQPTLLNGEPVEVVTEITVKFILQE